MPLYCWFIVVVAAVLIGLLFGLLLNKRIARWAEKKLVIPDDKLPKMANVVIGVGIDVSKDGSMASPYSKSVAEKCTELYGDDKVRNILFTGGYQFNFGNTEARAMKDCVRARPDEDHLLLEEKSFRTYLNADYSLPIVRRHQWTKVIIVAQQWHARRVLATFKKRWRNQGIDIYIVKAWSDYGGGSQSRLDYFLTFAAWDTLAFVISKLKGYC